MTGLTIVETGEVVETMTHVEAERITARIADKLDAIADNVEQVLPLIGEALTREAWKALGYPSPTAYVSDRFTGALTRLPVEVRRSVVTELSASGMSTRAIAPVVGVDHSNVTRDLQVVRTAPPAPSPRVSNATSPPVFTDEPGTVQRITGMDGKTYRRQPRPASSQADLANGTRNDLAMFAGQYRKFVDAIGKNLPNEGLAAAAREHIIQALQDARAGIDQATNRAISNIQGDMK